MAQFEVFFCSETSVSHETFSLFHRSVNLIRLFLCDDKLQYIVVRKPPCERNMFVF